MGHVLGKIYERVKNKERRKRVAGNCEEIINDEEKLEKEELTDE